MHATIVTIGCGRDDEFWNKGLVVLSTTAGIFRRILSEASIVTMLDFSLVRNRAED